jgi:hypothetical protein
VISGEQLVGMEQQRAAGGLTFWLRTSIVIGYHRAAADGDHDDRWPARQAQGSVPVQGDAGVRLLKQPDAGMPPRRRGTGPARSQRRRRPPGAVACEHRDEASKSASA